MPPADRISEQTVLDRMARLPHGKASYKQLVKELAVKGGLRDELEGVLLKLAARGKVVELRSGQYVLTNASREFTVGRLNVHRDGFGFVVPDAPIEGVRGDIYISQSALGDAMHGDRVIAKIGRIENTGRADGEVYEILKRAHPTVVGEFQVRQRGQFVIPSDERIQQWIVIPEGMEIPPPHENVDRVAAPVKTMANADELNGQIVDVELLEFPSDGGNPVGRVIEILGNPDDFGVDVEITIRKHHLPNRFPPEVLAQAAAMSNTIPEEELAQRQDFRALDIVTIDGETARDFDDAVWVDKLPNGHYALQVHIADVGHYVQPGSAIDREAYQRGTSVYFPDRAVPMLPLELSTGICSLRPQEDRLVLSALLEIDPRGDTIRQEFVRGVIRSAERMTYTNVHRLLEENDPELRDRYAPLLSRFQLMKELALVLNRKRHKRGSIDFDMPEATIQFDPEGEMIGVGRQDRTIAHRIIEEFMLAANEAVAGHLEELELPSLYRIHETPMAKRVLEFQELAARFGYALQLAGPPIKKFKQIQRTRSGQKLRKDVLVGDDEFTIDSRVYQKFIAQVEGKPEERILNYLLLRSLKQARYSAENKGHFALAAPAYTHFTSPIRRYPDLIVHRILAEQIMGGDPLYTREQLLEIGEDTSTTERRAAEAERELLEWKKIRFMNDRVGEEFAAMIISTTRFGFFVELETLFIEGLVPIDFLPGDRYFYEENNRKIVGQRSQRVFAIGDRVQVVLDRVDVVEKKLTFSLVEKARKGKPPRRARATSDAPEA